MQLVPCHFFFCLLLLNFVCVRLMVWESCSIFTKVSWRVFVVLFVRLFFLSVCVFGVLGVVVGL